MSFFEDMLFLGIGTVSEIKKNVEKLVNQGKISQEEAQRIFEDLKGKKPLDENVTPYSMLIGFTSYFKNKVQELLKDLQDTGKITAEEYKKYYERYIPEEIKDKQQKDEKYATKEDLEKIFDKLEKLEKMIKSD